MPVVMQRDITSPAYSQQPQGLYVQGPSLLHGIAEEDEAESPRGCASNASTCSSKEVHGRVAIGKAVMLNGKPPSRAGFDGDSPQKVGPSDGATTNWASPEHQRMMDKLETADAELRDLRARLRAVEKDQESRSRSPTPPLQVREAVETLPSRETCREEIAQALNGLRESHRRECEKAAHVLQVANDETREEALVVELLRSEARAQNARWEEQRDAFVGESCKLQASLAECNERIVTLELQDQKASKEILEMRRLHRTCEEQVETIKSESDQACRRAQAEARTEAAEAAEAFAKLRIVESERAQDAEAAFRMHADARQALEHLCHFVGRQQLGEDGANYLANAEVAAVTRASAEEAAVISSAKEAKALAAAASAEAAGLREELTHHYNAQRDLRHEISALSTAAAAVRTAAETKDQVISQLEARVYELTLQQTAKSPERPERGLSASSSPFAELDCGGVPPAQRSSPDIRMIKSPREVSYANEDAYATPLANMATWTHDVAISPIALGESQRSDSTPKLPLRGTPQLGTRALPAVDSDVTSATAAIAQLQQQLACCVSGEDAMPSAMAVAAMSAVKVALATLGEYNTSKTVQTFEAKEVPKLEEKALSVRIMSPTRVGGGSLQSTSGFAVPLAHEHPCSNDCEGSAVEPRNMTEELKSDIFKLKQILFDKNGALAHFEDDAKRLVMDHKLASTACGGCTSPDATTVPSFVAPDISQVAQQKLNEVQRGSSTSPLTMTRRSGSIPESSPDRSFRTLSPGPREHVESRGPLGSMHPSGSAADVLRQISEGFSTVGGFPVSQRVPAPIPHRRGLLPERVSQSTSSAMHSHGTNTPLCRSQQTLPGEPVSDAAPREAGEQSGIKAEQVVKEPKQSAPESAALLEKKAGEHARQVEASDASSTISTERQRAVSPLRQTSPYPFPVRTVQVTARSVDAPPSRGRFTTPSPGRMTPTGGASMEQLPAQEGSLRLQPSSSWQQRMSTACSIQTLEQTLQSLKMRASTPTPGYHSRSAEAPCMIPNMPIGSARSTPASMSKPLLSPSSYEAPGRASIVLTRPTTPLQLSSATAVVSGSSEPVRQVVRGASPTVRDPSRGRISTTPGVPSMTPLPSAGNNVQQPRASQSISPQPHRPVSSPVCGTSASGSVVIQRSGFGWQP